MIGTGMLITVVAVVFARLAYGLILPPMRADLGLSYQLAGNLATITALGYLCLVMIAGAVAARRGPRFAVLMGMVVVTLGFVGLSLATHYAMLVTLMLLLGIGTAFAYTPLVSLLVGWFPARRGAVIGFLNSGVGVGMLAAGWVVPYLVEVLGTGGWRMGWALFAVAGMLTTGATLAFLHDPPVASSAAGQLSGRPDKAAVYRNPRVIAVGILYGIIGLTYISQTIFMYSYALESGVSALDAGRLAGLMGLLSIFSGPAWGSVSDRIGRGNVLVLSISLTALGMALPAIWPLPAAFVLHYVLLGMTMTGIFTSVLAASTEHVEPQAAPRAVSYVTFFFAVGQFIGPAAAGLLIDHGGGFRSAFATSSLIMLAGVYVCWRIRKFKPVRTAASTPARHEA